ncbi:MAG: alpha/beta fold hydrolase [Deltaproteobacteria bacterium]|nr:alpha/beta fold hydrolase [Deltaproteobacteria bacterium]
MRPRTPSDTAPLSFAYADGRVSYIDEGQGEPIVAIAGLPGSSRDFRWLAPALAEHGRCIRLDLPGFGNSTRRSFIGMSIEQRGDVVIALLDQLRLSRVTLLGHSAGATVVADLACRHADRVERCALISGAGPRCHYPQGLYRAAAQLLRSEVGRALLKPLLRKVYQLAGFPSYLTDAERLFTAADAARMDFALHARNLAQVKQPTLISWATDDALIPQSIFEETVARVARASVLRFADGGHNIQKTYACELAQAIQQLG